MRVKKVNQVHTCKECKHGKPDMQFKNLSLSGDPTLIICKFQKWKQNIDKAACERFDMR